MDLKTNKENLQGWAVALNQLTRQATLIENMNVSLDIGHVWTMVRSRDPDQNYAAMGNVRQILMVLGKLPLKTVTLIVSDRSMSRPMRRSEADLHWNVGERQKWADGVKRDLLMKGKKAVTKEGFGDLAVRTKSGPVTPW